MEPDPAMLPPAPLRAGLALLALAATACPLVFAAEHITLRNGSEFDCARQELRPDPAGDRVRLYLFPTVAMASANANYVEVAADSVLRVDIVADPPAPAPESTVDTPPRPGLGAPGTPPLTPAEMHEMLARAGALHNIDTDLLASVVQAESAGNPRAVSRAGARGLMQLMPSTASTLGVQNSFAPEQNIGGGTAYLDQLLTRYHDDIALAVAAYNAGPAAVDRYHGIPPYAETRAYVARVIRAFNRRKLAAASLAVVAHPVAR